MNQQPTATPEQIAQHHQQQHLQAVLQADELRARIRGLEVDLSAAQAQLAQAEAICDRTRPTAFGASSTFQAIPKPEPAPEAPAPPVSAAVEPAPTIP